MPFPNHRKIAEYLQERRVSDELTKGGIEKKQDVTIDRKINNQLMPVTWFIAAWVVGMGSLHIFDVLALILGLGVYTN